MNKDQVHEINELVGSLDEGSELAKARQLMTWPGGGWAAAQRWPRGVQARIGRRRSSSVRIPSKDPFQVVLLVLACLLCLFSACFMCLALGMS